MVERGKDIKPQVGAGQSYRRNRLLLRRVADDWARQSTNSWDGEADSKFAIKRQHMHPYFSGRKNGLYPGSPGFESQRVYQGSFGARESKLIGQLKLLFPKKSSNILIRI